MQNTVLIIDFGAPETQQIAQHVRELQIYCEIHPFSKLPKDLSAYKAVILTHTPAATAKTPLLNLNNLPDNTPVLAIGENAVTDRQITVEIKDSNFLSSETAKNKFKDFLLHTAQVIPNWTPKVFITTTIADCRKKIGEEKVVLGLSGGVDSTVTAVLLNQAIGQNLFCIFVNHGLLRKNEFDSVLEQYKDMGLNVKGVDASQRFLDELKGVTDPEQKRKIIGRLFIEVFDEEAHKVQGVKYLAQGTIYPDVIESVSIDGKVAVKSHHNVGGLPERMNLKIVEPLRSLFKDEVRAVGKELGIKSEIIGRHPFPGPGLAVRILGDITAEKVETIQEADAIFIDHLKAAGLYDKVWQAGAILLPVNSVGKSGDKRTYERVVALRAIHSTNGMTADWIDFSYAFLQKVSNDIIQKVKGVNRVVYDISSKPPATIEWE